jgi:hypothetical protein
MKVSMLGICFLLMSVFPSNAQVASAKNIGPSEQELINLSKEKWQWMAEKNVDKLATLFHDKSKFVHMSGTWKKEEELEIIKSGSIWYKKADVHDVAVEIVDDVATAVVRGNDVVTEFTVTEVYKKQKKEWKMLALTFSSVRDTHVIKH